VNTKVHIIQQSIPSLEHKNQSPLLSTIISMLFQLCQQFQICGLPNVDSALETDDAVPGGKILALCGSRMQDLKKQKIQKCIP
jgi:hypothetical protein